MVYTLIAQVLRSPPPPCCELPQEEVWTQQPASPKEEDQVDGEACAVVHLSRLYFESEIGYNSRVTFLGYIRMVHTMCSLVPWITIQGFSLQLHKLVTASNIHYFVLYFQDHCT
jgi:hypothetical protein